MIIHVVSTGETLWQIANRYAVDINEIVQVNGLPNPNQLLVGQSLVIPMPGTSHTVQNGETLWSISQQYDVPVATIIQANQLANPDVLSPGSRLFIPPITHVIQPGETLGQIANRYGTTIQAIMNENQLANQNMIYPGIQLIIPRRKSVIEVNAYSYQSEEDAVNSLQAIGDLLTYFSPFAYMIREDGTLQPFNDERMIDAALSKNIVPMLSITNFTSTQAGSNVAHIILSNQELSNQVITNVLQVMDEKGYKVLNVDFENVLPEDRENYNQFLQLAVNRLHPRGYLVSTALAPKTSATQGGLLYEAHDYEAHGRIADFVILMTYEWEYRLGPPQAISPINQIRQVVEYALSVMPAEKIFLGFQIYARDWLLPHVQGQEAETFSPQEAVRRAVTHGAAIQYDTTAQSPFFRYTDEQGRQHEVWFEDARSAQAKFDLVKQYNLRGISYWALGYPYPQNWVLLNDNFTIRKFTP
ncbi:spore germination protein YaaH [Lentibacillus populi]|uniref:Spore germination protein YaaH n=1 Tax=Lentibacillus populi TaxID=1827502 RepID=A0A9W5X5A3_9BACI|nr:LysM peptidoglycan-binding domain-containing protein [Lentibacillus populi]MBT2214541.1 LysM peptidoglycan-binding domain-containing protein [Virgibacillus dakarensis]GGB41000.1 spore germination protein YaaH [Lentibacillus populi]